VVFRRLLTEGLARAVFLESVREVQEELHSFRTIKQEVS